MSRRDELPPPPARVPLVHSVVGWSLSLAFGVLRVLPARICFVMADALAIPMVVLSWLREFRVGRGVNRNLRIAFREQLSPKEARRLRWAWARHMTRIPVDFCRMPSIDQDNVSQFVELDEFEALRAACGPSRGLICVTGHFGVPELLGHVASLMGIQATSVFRPNPIRPVEDRLAAIRTSGGQKVLPKWGSIWPLKKALDRGESIGLAVDEDTSHNPEFVPFLGTMAATSATPALLHLRTRAPIAVVSVHRIGVMRYRFHLWGMIQPTDPDAPERSPRAVLEQVNQALSRAILQYPDQWFWGMKRFRTRPPGEVLGADGLPPPAIARPGQAQRRVDPNRTDPKLAGSNQGEPDSVLSAPSPE